MTGEAGVSFDWTHYGDDEVAKCPATSDRRRVPRALDRREVPRPCGERITRAGPGVRVLIRVKPLHDPNPRPGRVTSIQHCPKCDTVLELCFIASEAA